MSYKHPHPLTVAELIERLQRLPQDHEVVVQTSIFTVVHITDALTFGQYIAETTEKDVDPDAAEDADTLNCVVLTFEDYEV